MNIQKITIILIHAFVGWMLCAATMGVGMAVTTMDNTLIIHAIGAPCIFSLISLFYFNRFHYTPPMQTAIWFLLIVVLMDFFLVALIINGSLEMFQSLLGTWIPIALIFAATYLTGLFVVKRTQPQVEA